LQILRSQTAEAVCPSTQSTPRAETSRVFWRVEGSLLRLSAVRPLTFFTWNAQSFAERWARRGLIALSAMVRPFLFASDRILATRALHTVLRGVSRDRLDLLGEEYFEYVLKPRLYRPAVEELQRALARGEPIVLVGQALDHVLRPLARHFGVEWILANRMEFRDGRATGRLLEPVVRPRGGLALLRPLRADGRVTAARLMHDLGYTHRPDLLEAGITSSARTSPKLRRPAVRFDCSRPAPQISVRRAYRGRRILLVGGTGFIGKVWLADALLHLPELDRIYVLVRPRRGTSALRRFERIVAESPVFEPLARRHGPALGSFLADRLQIIEGDAARPGLGLTAADREHLARSVDLVVNCSGLTDFNPDLREAVAVNIDAVLHLLEFVQQSRRAALLHLSTCYVAGMRDGRFAERLQPDYTPRGIAGFDAENELAWLRRRMAELEQQAQSADVEALLRQQSRQQTRSGQELSPEAFEHQLRKNRLRWLRQQMVAAGMQRAAELGWPNTYTYTKSLAESLLARRGAGQRIAIARPAIVESSLERPIPAWNEGINTSASLSYLLGTYFRQFPSNERKRLDLVPVDLVARGITLIGAALLEGQHVPVYHLATSVSNPCSMGRAIELTGLAHRKFYRTQQGLEPWLRSRLDPIPVSKRRYQRLSAPAQRALVQTINRAASPLFRRAPLARRERSLEWVENLIALFEPFILHNEHSFEDDQVRLLAAGLPAEERALFDYDPFTIDWWEYWINIHVPALRRWSYPLIEGRHVEITPREFRWPELGQAAQQAARETAG